VGGSRSLPKRVLLSIVLMGFAGQVAWAVENQYFNVFLYNAVIPDPMYISHMVALSAIVATATSILVGAYSDARTTRWGKRKPYLLFGYPVWGVVTALFPTAALLRPAVLAAWFAIVWDCIMTFFGSTAYDANFNAYVVDATTVENRGFAMGIVSLLGYVSLLLIYGFAGFFIEAYGYFAFFYLVGAVVSVLGTLGALLAVEPQRRAESGVGVLSRIKESFSAEFVKKHKDVFLILLASGIQGMGYQVYFPYILLYIQHYLGFPLHIASLVVFVAILSGIIAAIPAGVLVDRLGRRTVALMALPLNCAAVYALSLVKGLPDAVALGIMWVSFSSVLGVAMGAWLRDLYPEEKRGEFSGYTILFNVAFTMVPGPLIGSWLIHAFGERRLINGEEAVIPAPVIFQVGAAIALFSLLPMLKVKETLEKRKVERESASQAAQRLN